MPFRIRNISQELQSVTIVRPHLTYTRSALPLQYVHLTDEEWDFLQGKPLSTAIWRVEEDGQPTPPPGPVPSLADVTDGNNVGSGSGYVFKAKNGTILEFRRLLAGSGVSISTDDDDVIISSTGGGDGATAANITLSPAQVLAMHSIAAVLVAAPGAGKFIEIKSAELFLDFNTTPYTGGDDLIIDYMTTPNDNLVIDGGLVTAAADSRRFVTPYTPVPDTNTLGLNEPVVIRCSVPFLGGDSPLKVRLMYVIRTAIL